MIPIFSIVLAIIFFVLFFCFLKLYLSYKRTRLESIGLISKVYLFISLFFLFVATPALLIKDLTLVEISFELSFFCIFIAIAYFSTALFRLFLLKSPPKFLFFCIILLGLGVLIFNILNLKPALIHFYNNFVFYEESRSLIVNILSGGLVFSFFLTGTFFFIYGGLKIQDRIIKLRAFLLTLAILFLALGAGIRFLFGFLMNVFWSTSLATFFAGISAILMIISTFLLKPKKEQFVKKIY